MIFLFLDEEEKLDNTWKHSCNSREFYFIVLDLYKKSIRINKIPRCGLLNVNKNAWMYQYDVNNDSGFITLTGMNLSAFNNCLDLFAPYFGSY